MKGAMNPRVKAIMIQVEQLTEDERLELENELLLGDPAEQEAVERAWAEECARRLEEVRSGKVKPLSAEEFMARLRATE